MAEAGLGKGAPPAKASTLPDAPTSTPAATDTEAPSPTLPRGLANRPTHRPAQPGGATENARPPSRPLSRPPEEAPPPKAGDLPPADLYQRFCKPGLGAILKAFGLDIVYEKAQGDLLTWRDPAGRRRTAIDLVGSFGATLLGHNPPRLRRVLHAALRDCPPVLVQASVRGEAARLAARLNGIARARLGADYVMHLCNSGAEAVEAAIKHLILIRRGRLQAWCEEILTAAAGLLRQRDAPPGSSIFRSLSDFLGEKVRDVAGVLAVVHKLATDEHKKLFKPTWLGLHTPTDKKVSNWFCLIMGNHPKTYLTRVDQRAKLDEIGTDPLQMNLLDKRWFTFQVAKDLGNCGPEGAAQERRPGQLQGGHHRGCPPAGRGSGHLVCDEDLGRFEHRVDRRHRVRRFPRGGRRARQAVHRLVQ